MKKYQPSNGSEGIDFTETYCMNCTHCDPDPYGEKQCDILCRSMVYNINDPEYPREWVKDDDGRNPRCTAWVKWDWGNDGDPDDPENPKAPPPPPDPSQINMFPLYPYETVFEPKKEKHTV